MAWWDWLIRPKPRPDRAVLFLDDFMTGTRPDPAKWSHHLGSTGYEPSAIYTDDPTNSFLKDQQLVIRATPCVNPPVWWPTAKYQSPWLHTQGKFDAGIGTAWSARIKFTPEAGCWPCFWLLGSTSTGSNWPLCGEVDILELFGTRNAGITVHTPITGVKDTYKASKSLPVDANWHTFRCEWDTSGFKFFIDGGWVFTVDKGSLPNWMYDGTHSFFVILSMAAGGVGTPVTLPADMLVDWVKVTRL